jgi:hypothetical protein
MAWPKLCTLTRALLLLLILLLHRPRTLRQHAMTRALVLPSLPSPPLLLMTSNGPQCCGVGGGVLLLW